MPFLWPIWGLWASLVAQMVKLTCSAGDPGSIKVCQSYGFSSSHVWMWDLDHKEDWALKNWYFQTVVLEKTLESPLESKEIKPVNPKGNQPWILTGRTDAVLIFWPPDAKSWLIGKDPDAGKHWGQEEKGGTEDEIERVIGRKAGGRWGVVFKGRK